MFAAHVQTTRWIIARKINSVKIYFAKEELVANIFAGTHRSAASFECPLQHFAVASYDEILPRVEYSLTKKGSFVVPILQSICGWAGLFFKEEPEQMMTQYQKCNYR